MPHLRKSRPLPFPAVRRQTDSAHRRRSLQKQVLPESAHLPQQTVRLHTDLQALPARPYRAGHLPVQALSLPIALVRAIPHGKVCIWAPSPPPKG